jgi:hypothetical protein
MRGGFFQELNELIREGAVFVEHGKLLTFIVREVERPCSPTIQGAMQAASLPGNLQKDIRQIEGSRIIVLSDVEGLARFTFVDEFHALENALETGCFEIDVDPTIALQEAGFVEEVARNDSDIAHARMVSTSERLSSNPLGESAVDVSFRIEIHSVVDHRLDRGIGDSPADQGAARGRD